MDPKTGTKLVQKMATKLDPNRSKKWAKKWAKKSPKICSKNCPQTVQKKIALFYCPLKGPHKEDTEKSHTKNCHKHSNKMTLGIGSKYDPQSPEK